MTGRFKVKRRKTKINTETLEKKPREARFFLSKMREQEALVGDKEPFDFYLSAFLNAAKTILSTANALNNYRLAPVGSCF
jgi:hypothetical protein